MCKVARSVMQSQAAFCQIGRNRVARTFRKVFPFHGKTSAAFLACATDAIVNASRIERVVSGRISSMRGIFVTSAILFSVAPTAAAQDAARLIELFPAAYQYRVSCRVAIEGTLKL